MNLAQAHDAIDAIDPHNITVEAYPRLARALVTIRDEEKHLNDERQRVVGRALRELYRYCENSGQDWSKWTGA